jgi:O-antigen/teichoic acid export membrane protein
MTSDLPGRPASWLRHVGPVLNQLAKRSVGWTLADQILVSGSNFLTSVIVARGLGPAGLGTFALSWIVVLFGQSILAAAFAQPIMSLGPKQQPEEAERYYGASFTLQTLGAVACGLLLALAVPISPALGDSGQVGPLLLPLAACILVSQIQDYLRRYNFTRGWPHRAFVGDAAKYAAQLGGLVLLFVMDREAADVPSALWVITGAATIGCIPFIGAMPKLVLQPSDLAKALRRNLVFSRWLVGAALLQWLTGNFFLIVSGLLLGPAVTGILRAGQTLLGTLHVFFQAADNIVPPRAARLHHERGDAAVFALVNRLLVLGGSATALIALILALPGDFWMIVLFGHAFAGTGPVVAAYGITYVLIACTMPLRYGFLATEKTSAIFISYAIASGFNLVVAWPIVSIFGETGALVGLVMVQAVLVSAMFIQYRGIVRRPA